jgi:hypothetical protein
MMENKIDLVSYVRNFHNQKVGILISSLNQNKITMGWAFCNSECGDKFTLNQDVLVQVNESVNEIIDTKETVRVFSYGQGKDKEEAVKSACNRAINIYVYSLIANKTFIFTDSCISGMSVVKETLYTTGIEVTVAVTLNVSQIKSSIQKLGYLFITPMHLAELRMNCMDEDSYWIEKRNVIYQPTFIEVNEKSIVRIDSKLPREYYGDISRFIFRCIRYYKGKQLCDSLRMLIGMFSEKGLLE